MVHLKSVPGFLLPLEVPGVHSQGREEGRWGMRQGATHRGLDIKGHGRETLGLMLRVFSPVARAPGLDMRWVSRSCVSIFPQLGRACDSVRAHSPWGIKVCHSGVLDSKHPHSSAAPPLACELVHG